MRCTARSPRDLPPGGAVDPGRRRVQRAHRETPLAHAPERRLEQPAGDALTAVLGPHDDRRDAAHRDRAPAEPLTDSQHVQRADDLRPEEGGHHLRGVDERGPPLAVGLLDRERLRPDVEDRRRGRRRRDPDLDVHGRWMLQGRRGAEVGEQALRRTAACVRCRSRRPCRISRSENAPRSSGGTSPFRSSSTFTGSVSFVSLSRVESRPTCVSTGRPGQAERDRPHDVAGLAADPGERHEVGELGGHLAVEALLDCAAPCR